jgi:hypothetical protein
MASWIAMIGSAVIGSLLLLSFLRYGNDVTRDSYLTTLEHLTYGNLVEATQVIERDLSQIGFGVNDPDVTLFVDADSTDVRFLMDWNNDASIDTVRYYLSDVSSVTMTDNPNDRVLFRSINNNPDEIVAVGLIDFNIRYFDSLGNETASFDSIRVLELELVVESTINYDNEYPRIVWHGKVTPPNLYGK